MKILITGGRDFNNKLLIENTLNQFINEWDIVLHGGAMGADTLADDFCKLNNIQTEIYKPQYEIWGKDAPLIRNTEMVKKCDVVIAFWNGKSKGTKYTIDKADRYNKKTYIIYY